MVYRGFQLYICLEKFINAPKSQTISCSLESKLEYLINNRAKSKRS